jgi:hypothetical protein
MEKEQDKTHFNNFELAYFVRKRYVSKIKEFTIKKYWYSVMI